MALEKKDPVSVLLRLWKMLVVGPWQRVRGIHEKAPDPTFVRTVYRFLWILGTPIGLTVFLVPILELIVLYAFIYYTVALIIRLLETIGVLG